MCAYFPSKEGFLNKREASKESKMNIYKKTVRPTLTYGCETFEINAKQKSELQAVNIIYLKKVVKEKTTIVTNTTIGRIHRTETCKLVG